MSPSLTFALIGLVLSFFDSAKTGAGIILGVAVFMLIIECCIDYYFKKLKKYENDKAGVK